MKNNLKKLSEMASNVSRSFNFKEYNQVVFLNTGDILEGEFLHENITDTLSENLPGQAKKAIQKFDILYSEIRPGNKRYLFVEKDLNNYVVSTKFMVIEANKEIVFPKFLYYLLIEKQCEQVFKTIADSRSGTFPQITFDAISFYEFSLPPMEIQKKIAYFIDNLNNEIKLNNQIISNLERLSQVLYQSWFLDFDPVFAKKYALDAGLTKEQAERAAIAVIAGICSPVDYVENEIEIEQKLKEKLITIGKVKAEELKLTASLFPSEFEDMESGKRPIGWNSLPLSDITTKITDGSHSSPKTVKVGKPIASVKDMHNWGLDLESSRKISEKDYQELVNGNCKPTIGDVLIAKDGSYLKHVFMVQEEEDVVLLSSVAILSPAPNISPRFLVLSLLDPSQKARLKNCVSGAGVPRIILKEFRRFQILVPNPQLLLLFDKLLLPLFAMSHLKTKENKKISELRDTLLPQLFAGEINLDNIKIEESKIL